MYWADKWNYKLNVIARSKSDEAIQWTAAKIKDFLAVTGGAVVKCEG